MEGALSEEGPGSRSSRLVHFATITSRVEAFVLRSALESEGIHVWMGAEHHGGTEVISHALGGYRLEIFEADLPRASALARELDWPDGEIIYEGQKQAVLKLLAVLLGYQFFWTIPAVIMGAFPASMLALILLNQLTYTPVDPRGRNDFYLAGS